MTRSSLLCLHPTPRICVYDSEYLNPARPLVIPVITSPLQPSLIALTPAAREFFHLLIPQPFTSPSPKALSASCLVLGLLVCHSSLINPVHPPVHLASWSLNDIKPMISQTWSHSYLLRAHHPAPGCQARSLNSWHLLFLQSLITS